MNGIQLRKGVAPLTPNLEDYKQKNKSKSRRKGCIQPTNPPTPKINRPHLTLKPTQDKYLEIKEPPTFCPMHPDRPATRYLDHTKNRYCTKCYLLTNEDLRAPEEVETEKKKELDEFRVKIKGFGLKLEEAEECIREWGFLSDQNFFRQKQYICESFDTLRISIDEKQRQLLSQLMSSQQQIKRSVSMGSSTVQEMKKAIARYIQDIQNNYEDIIESLSYEQFDEIIDKYTSKIKYFQHSVEEICMESSLNVYIPRKDIQKCISKATVQVYPELEKQEGSNHNRTLQRYPTEKNNIYLDGSSKGYLSQHQESVGNKMSQHRQSRDREYFCGRGVGSKENHHFDNHIFH